MNETMVTVVGNVATAPEFREGATGSVARFRLAVTARYRDRAADAWTDGHTNFFTVWARRGLAANVAASITLGEPVVVRGRLKVRTDDRGGRQRMSADIDAQVVGHDLSRGTAAFRRAARTGADGAAAAEHRASADAPEATTGACLSAAAPVHQAEPADDGRPAAAPDVGRPSAGVSSAAGEPVSGLRVSGGPRPAPAPVRSSMPADRPHTVCGRAGEAAGPAGLMTGAEPVFAAPAHT